jgi:asparagine synthase (glutamine-hydrolysing)
MSMAHAVEVRPPFLDHRIVEFAATVPRKLKIRGSQQKIVLRELRKAKLPATIREGKKTGFDIPAHEWLRGTLRSLLLETVREDTGAYGDLFHAAAIDQLAQRHLKRQANIGYHLWGLLILFQWTKKWEIQTSARPTTIFSLAGAGS